MFQLCYVALEVCVNLHWRCARIWRHMAFHLHCYRWSTSNTSAYGTEDESLDCSLESLSKSLWGLENESRTGSSNPALGSWRNLILSVESCPQDIFTFVALVATARCSGPMSLQHYKAQAEVAVETPGTNFLFFNICNLSASNNIWVVGTINVQEIKRFKEGLILILRKCCNLFSRSIPVGSPECCWKASRSWLALTSYCSDTWIWRMNCFWFLSKTCYLNLHVL